MPYVRVSPPTEAAPKTYRRVPPPTQQPGQVQLSGPGMNAINQPLTPPQASPELVLPNNPYERQIANEGAFGRFMGGVADRAAQLAEGGLNLVGVLSDEEAEKFRLQRARARRLRGAAGEVGGLGFDVLGTGALSLPLSVGARAVAGAAGLGPGLTSGIMLGGDVLGTGLYEGLRLPSVGETREGNIKWGAGTALALGGAGTLVSNTFRRAMHPKTRSLLDEDLPATVGTAYPGLRNAENIAAGLPMVGKAIQKQRDKMVEGYFSKRLADEAGVPGAEKLAPTEAIRKTRDKVKSDYETLWKQVDPSKIDGVPALEATIKIDSDFMPNIYSPETRRAVKNAQDNILDAIGPASGVPNKTKLQTADDSLRDLLNSKIVKGDRAAQGAIKELRKGLANSLPDNIGGKLKKTDKSYERLSLFSTAATKTKAARKEGNVATPERLLDEVYKRSKDKIAYAAIDDPFQKELMDAVRVIDPVAGGGQLGTIAARIMAIGNAIQNPISTLGVFAGMKGLYNSATKSLPSSKMLTTSKSLGRAARTQSALSIRDERRRAIPESAYNATVDTTAKAVGEMWRAIDKSNVPEKTKEKRRDELLKLLSSDL